MNNFSFESKINEELTDNEKWVFDLDKLGGELSDLPYLAKDNDIIKVTGDDTVQITISKDLMKEIPSAKAIMYMIFRAIRSIVCPKCGGAPKA